MMLQSQKHFFRSSKQNIKNTLPILKFIELQKIMQDFKSLFFSKKNLQDFIACRNAWIITAG